MKHQKNTSPKQRNVHPVSHAAMAWEQQMVPGVEGGLLKPSLTYGYILPPTRKYIASLHWPSLGCDSKGIWLMVRMSDPGYSIVTFHSKY